MTANSDHLHDMLRRAREREARRNIDRLLADAVRSGATTVMDEADFASIRKAAKAPAVRARPKR